MLENAVLIQTIVGCKMQQMLEVFLGVWCFFGFLLMLLLFGWVFFKGTARYPKKKPDPKKWKILWLELSSHVAVQAWADG